MRRIGQLLMLIGLAVGGAVGLGILLHVTIPGISWLVAVGLAKLSLVASGGLLASGAVLQRLAARHEASAQRMLSESAPSEAEAEDRL
jgi:hypothetical protein